MNLNPFCVLSILLTALVCAFVPAQSGGKSSERKSIADFQKAVLPRGASTAPARIAGLASLDRLDSDDVAEALIRAYRAVSAELAQADQERLAAQDELREILGDQATSAQRTLPQDQANRYSELRQITVSLRAQIGGLRDLLDALGTRVAELESEGAHDFLIQKVLKGKKDPLPIRLAAARALGRGGEARAPELVKALKRARRVPEQLAILDALTTIGPAARQALPELLEQLEAKEEAVRERAALALASLKQPEAIAPLIELLSREEGMVQKRIAGTLETLTRQAHGESVGAWRAWYEAEGKSLTAAELGGGRPAAAKRTPSAADGGAYYFGLPQDGKGIVYVIDASGSMSKMIRLNPKGTGTVGGGKIPETSRLEACKKELIRALGQLSPGRKFNVVWYNDLAHIWQPKMTAANPGSIAKAQAWVRKLQHASTTNIHDALQLGFSQVGRGVHDKYYGVEVDTIFLLTDGSPTLPDGQPDSTDKILQAVRQWNPLQRITIHTIGIGGELNSPFLQQLARENGGEFKSYR